MRAVIMAGGKGTRLAALHAEIPKPMFPVCGKPILAYQVESLAKSGVGDITLIVGHLKEVVKGYFADGQRFGVRIGYIEEDEPLGTAGALYFLKGEPEDFILVFGDLILDIDFKRFMGYHKGKGAAITLYGHPNAHPYDSDVVEVDGEHRVTGILRKDVERRFYYHNFVNAGLYCINPAALDQMETLQKIDFEKQFISRFIKQGRVYAYKSTEYVKDMGTPDRLAAVLDDIENGVVSARSLKQKQKAIFLGWYGMLHKHAGRSASMEDFELLPAAAEAIARVNASPYLVLLATDQPVGVQDEATFQEFDSIHKKMETELGNRGAYLDDIVFCPHQDILKIGCGYRKLGMGALTKEAEKYNIDLRLSWYIGDAIMDIQTGQNAGMKTALLQTDEAGTYGKYHVKPDYIAKDLMAAVNHILG